MTRRALQTARGCLALPRRRADLAWEDFPPHRSNPPDGERMPDVQAPNVLRSTAMTATATPMGIAVDAKLSGFQAVPTRLEAGQVVELEAMTRRLPYLLDLPFLNQGLEALVEQVRQEDPRDYKVLLRELAMLPNGHLTRGNSAVAWTYHGLAQLLSGFCDAPRNVTQNVVHLRTNSDPNAIWSARAVAFDDIVSQASETRTEPLTFRTIQAHGRRALRSVVSSTRHSLEYGDDLVLVGAIRAALGDKINSVKASVRRWTDCTRIDIVLPEVSLQVGSGERYFATLHLVNSETGSKSWGVSGGLWSTKTGASILGSTGEGSSASGRHVGHRVADRMINEVVEAVGGVRDLADTFLKTYVQILPIAFPTQELVLGRTARRFSLTQAITDAVAKAWAGDVQDADNLGGLVKALSCTALDQTADAAEPIDQVVTALVAKGWEALA